MKKVAAEVAETRRKLETMKFVQIGKQKNVKIKHTQMDKYKAKNKMEKRPNKINLFSMIQ